MKRDRTLLVLLPVLLVVFVLGVGRFFQPLDNLREGRRTTLFVLGAQAYDMDYSTEDEYKKLEQFMFDGGRIVISFAPVNTKPWATRRAQAKEEKKTGEKTSPKKEQK